MVRDHAIGWVMSHVLNGLDVNGTGWIKHVVHIFLLLAVMIMIYVAGVNSIKNIIGSTDY